MHILKTIKSNHGFIRSNDVAELVQIDRLRRCLLRFDRCRLVCAAQDIETIIETMERGGQSLRDVQLATVASTSRYQVENGRRGFNVVLEGETVYTCESRPLAVARAARLNQCE